MNDDTILTQLQGSTVVGPDRRQWIRTVLSHSGLTAAHKTVLVALEMYADYRDGTNARPGEAHLAHDCDLQPRAVRYALERGQQLGLIDRTAPANPKAGKAAVYRLVMPPTTGTTMPVETDTTGTAMPVNNFSTGTAMPVEPATTGTAMPVNNFSTGTAMPFLPARTCRPPNQDLNNTSVLPNPGTSPARDPEPHTPPVRSPFCDRHPNGTPQRCGDCANARTAFTVGRDRAAQADAELAAVDDLERLRRRKTIDACPDCDDFGRLDDLSPCPHPKMPRAGNG